jgi:TIR domain
MGLGCGRLLNESLSGRIFICYRRQDTAWPAGRLYDALAEHFSAEQLFKDVDSINPGDDFVELITAAVASCDVLLALIGSQWLTVTDWNGRRRLDDPNDYVRLELETALTRNIRVIPILVDDALMPRADELPPTLAPLVRRNAVEINPLTFDTKRLIATVSKTLELEVSDKKPDRPNQQVAGPEVEQLYDRALTAFWTEQWDEAADLFGQVLSRQPGYADADRKLELVRRLQDRQQELARHYAEASVAADAGDWELAVAKYSMVAEAAGYRDTNDRLAEARQQHRLATLQAGAQLREPKIFLCYRREDTQGFARGMYERLARKYGPEQVFRDIDSTPAGFRFSMWIESMVGQCSVMVVLIGNAWSSALDHTGKRRLDLPKDWVRQEIEIALKRDIPIIPVRVQGAPMPSDDELPASIADLAGFQSAEVTDSRWEYDVGQLIQTINRLIASDSPRNEPGEGPSNRPGGRPRNALGGGPGTGPAEAQERARWEAEEQARREAQERARWEAEEQARRQAEELARRWKKTERWTIWLSLAGVLLVFVLIMVLGQ